MNLSVIYSKTPKGLRARASLIGGLSSHLMKVLTHVDGTSKVETILLKFDKLSPQQLSADLTKLEQAGYIRLATVTTASGDAWALTVNFAPMVVEEYQSEEELEVNTQAKIAEKSRQQQQQAEQLAQQQAEQVLAIKLAAEQEAQQEEEQRQLAQQVAQQAAQQKADKKTEKLRAKQKSKAETKVKALLEQERIAIAKADETARIEMEAKAKLSAQQEAARIAEQQAAQRATQLAEEIARKAALKAREVAEQAEIDAEEKAKQHAHREIERISRDAENAQKKAEAAVKVQQENERLEALNVAQAAKNVAEQARQAELKAQAENKAQLERAAKEAAEQASIEAKAIADASEKERLEQAEKAAQQAVLKEKLAQEQKDKARLEIANVLRKAEDDRKNAVAQAKAEKLAAKQQAKAEQETRLQAERKAKEEAKFVKEEKIKAQAEEKAKLEAAEHAKRELAQIAKQVEIARAKAEQQAKQAAEVLAINAAPAQPKVENVGLEQGHTVQVAHSKLVAEQQANSDAKENARLEMERIGHEADLARQKSTTQQHLAEVKKGKSDKNLTVGNDFEAAEAAEEAAFAADEQAEEAVEKIQHTIRNKATKNKATRIITQKTAKQSAEDAGRADIKNAAKIEADAKASLYSNAQAFVSTKKIMQWLRPLTKVTFIYVPVLALLLILLLHFINFSILIKPIEQLASESIGESVIVKKVHASLWPQPHLVLENVAIGNGNHIKAVHVLPVAASLFEDIKVVKSLVIEGLNIEQANFNQPLQWVNNLGDAKNLIVKQINLKNLTLTIRDLQLESFDGKVTLTDAGKLSAVDLVSSNNALSVMIKPQTDQYEIALKAANWVLPFNPKIVFSTLTAKGLASQNKINFSQIKGEIYGGNLIGQANIQWPDGASQWSGIGDFKLSNANTEVLLNNFGSAVIIDGQLALDANFSGKAREANKLANAMITNANFDVRQGRIQGLALARGVLSPGRQSLAGDNTDFDKLTGSIKISQNQVQFGKLVLASSQLNANGFININANQILTGRVNANLATKSRQLKANFAITGRGKDLKSQ